ncbi:MAG TPA: hypothetical protein VJ813_06780 [Vicinamibacterales bacterium]|nr:hypothetical protein [Vicinamibacterales bacterium]
MKRLAPLVLACAVLGSCASPEATRQRGGGPGGDTGNRPSQVMMHEGSRQYWETRVVIPGEGPPLAPSEQARHLSLPSTRTAPPPTTGEGRGQ